MSLTSILIRTFVTRKDSRRDSGLSVPPEIERFDNIQYAKDPVWNLLDVYRPKQYKGKKLPVIINFHGGAWVYSTKDTYQYYCMSLAQHGFTVVNFSYRLAPENKFPDNLEDSCNAVRWIVENAEKYLFDLDNIFIVADSAGCHIAGLFLAACTDKSYANEFELNIPSKFKVNAIAFNCGCYMLLKHGSRNSKMAVRDLIKDLLPENGSEYEEKYLNVNEHVNKYFPPAFIMSCSDDFLLYQEAYITEAYELNGLEYKRKIYNDINGRKLKHIFHVDIRNANAVICNDEECDFFKKHIKNAAP